MSIFDVYADYIYVILFQAAAVLKLAHGAFFKALNCCYLWSAGGHPAK